MNKIDLHIVSFDVPFPPDYGGVIDVFWKIKALYELGVNIHLHCFDYGRGKQLELEKYCTKVHYYHRKSPVIGNFSFLPYIVFSRINEELLNNLMEDTAPILFEGLHTTGFIADERLSRRLKIYRESNIEHEYYWNLMKSEPVLTKKIFFAIESVRLRMYQSMLRYADYFLPVSEADEWILRNEFPEKEITLIPSFHPFEKPVFQNSSEEYCLYHGNLSVSENEAGGVFLINQVFRGGNKLLKIAGKNPSDRLLKIANSYPNVELIPNPDEGLLNQLISNAKINLFYTPIASGLKLKLLHALFLGGHCLVNVPTIEGTSLGEAVKVANSPEDFQNQVLELFKEEFSSVEWNKRMTLLEEKYSNRRNAEKLLKIIRD